MGSRANAAPRPRLPEFLAGDPLRGIGALAIISYHTASASLRSAGVGERHAFRAGAPDEFGALGPTIGPLIETGGLLLGVFFVLSGYLIGRPFVFAVVRGEPLPRLSSFARNRFLRIVPAFWFVFTVLVIVYGTRGASAWEILSAYSFVEYVNRTSFAQVYAQAWSLRAELLFYVLVPLTAWLLLRATRRLRRGAPLRTAIVIALPLVAAVIVVWVNSWMLPELAGNSNPTLGFHGLSLALVRVWYHLPLVVFYMFLPGLMLAALETFLPSRVERFGRRHPRAAWAVPTLVALTGFMLLYSVQRFDPMSVPLGAAMIFTGISGFIGGLLLLQWATGSCWRLLNNGLLRWLGQRSYSIYLVHLAIVAELAPRIARELDYNYKQTYVALLAASIAGSVLLGEVTFRLVEAPFMNLKISGWRSSERAAVFRRAAWWLPSRAIEVMRRRRRAPEAPAAEPVPESAAASEPPSSPSVPSSS
jgi:peptidoglycan/LPS O-acetylase OafA/YrhL